MSYSSQFAEGDVVRVRTSPGTADARAWRDRTLRVVRRAVHGYLVVVDVADPTCSGLLHETSLEHAPGAVEVDVLDQRRAS